MQRSCLPLALIQCTRAQCIECKRDIQLRHQFSCSSTCKKKWCVIAGAKLEEVRTKLLRALVKGLLQQKSRSKSFDWCSGMLKQGGEASLEALMDTCLQTKIPFAKAINKLAPGFAIRGDTEAERAQLLCLRGLLGCGVLVHCLCLRHRVDYGVNHRCRFPICNCSSFMNERLHSHA
jgi:hypothetical protein